MNKYQKIKDFDASRLRGVGSSDTPVLAGLFRGYKKTTLTLWQEKTSRTPPWEGNERTKVGTDLEAYPLYRFIKARYGNDVAADFYHAKLRGKSSGPFKANTEAVHPERRYCLAHADLLVDTTGNEGPDTEPYIVEAKVVGLMAGKRREGKIFTGYDIDGDKTSQDIPDAVFLQVQWQCYVYGVNLAYVAALIDNQYHEFGPIRADPRVQEKCLALAERFWALVQADEPPTPETWDDVAALYPSSTDTTAMISGDVETQVREMIAEDKRLAEHIKNLNERRDDIENAIGILIGENAVLASGEGDTLARRTMSTPRASIALTDMKKKAPELYAHVEQAGWIKTGESKPQVRY